MKAMIFAAGLGTRLKPLTNKIPKALVEVNGKTLLEHNICKLKSAGTKEIIINVHHYPDLITEFLERKKNFGIHIEISDESCLLLDTGGGLKKAAWFLETKEPFILHNADILSDINIQELYSEHLKNKCLATLVMKKRNTSRYFLVNQNNEVCGWTNIKENKTIISKNDENLNMLAFCGIHVISPEIFQFFQNEPHVFSIIDKYLELCKKHKIFAIEPKHSYWFDIGNIDKLKQAETYLKINK